MNTTTMTKDNYQVGAIIDSSWGYDQTNIDFYRIEKRTNQTVWLMPMRSKHVEDTGWLQGKKVPSEPKSLGDYEVGCSQSRWDGKLIRRKLSINKETGEVRGLSICHGWASYWDGNPSWYSQYA